MPTDDPAPNDAEDIIARAKRELAERMFDRMREDDEQDERDGVELSDSSTPSPSEAFASDDWDLSGRSSSLKAGSELAGSSSLGDLASSDEGTGTLAEGSAKVYSTLDLSSRLIQESLDDAEASTNDVPRAPAYRPGRRPAMAVLVAFDDGGATGERVRIRKSPFDVGRVEGDLLISHDQQMSRRHFRIERRRVSDDQASPWEWSLTDLESLNGTFLRHGSVPLTDGDEMLLGSEVLKIRQRDSGAKLVLTKVGVGNDEERVSLEAGEHLLGADPQRCVRFLAGSPLLAPEHLRLTCDRSLRWTVTALPGTDGVWKRTTSFPLTDGVYWQAGEQRFALFLR